MPTPARAASSSCEKPIRARAALIWRALITSLHQSHDLTKSIYYDTFGIYSRR